MSKTFKIELTEEEMVVLWRLTNQMGSSITFNAIRNDSHLTKIFGQDQGYYTGIWGIAEKVLLSPNPLWKKLNNLCNQEAFNPKTFNSFEPVKVMLNSEHQGLIQKDGSVVVGCQTFTKEKILELAAKVKEVTSKQE